MIVSWIEWSDGGLSMHENIKGLAKETIRGSVRHIPPTPEQHEWEYTSIDGRVKGTTKTRQEAMDTLKATLGALEIEEHDEQRGTKWRA